MNFIEKISKKKIKKKLNMYQKNILSIEQKYFLNKVNFFNKIDFIDKIDLIIKNISNYKFVVNLLYSNPEFYSEIKYIQIDYLRESIDEITYLEIIWIHEHYEYIEQIRSCESDIIKLVEFANKYNIITYVQYKFVKKIFNKINKIFESDKSMNEFYNIKFNITSNTNIFTDTTTNTINDTTTDTTTDTATTQLELFFDIIDIILLKLKINLNLIKKTKLKILNIKDISNNHTYINLISKIKFNLKKKLSTFNI